MAIREIQYYFHLHQRPRKTSAKPKSTPEGFRARRQEVSIHTQQILCFRTLNPIEKEQMCTFIYEMAEQVKGGAGSPWHWSTTVTDYRPRVAHRCPQCLGTFHGGDASKQRRFQEQLLPLPLLSITTAPPTSSLLGQLAGWQRIHQIC